jgi:hypothetical protein
VTAITIFWTWGPTRIPRAPGGAIFGSCDPFAEKKATDAELAAGAPARCSFCPSLFYFIAADEKHWDPEGGP